MMVVYKTCSEFIRTIPSIALDEDSIEEIEDGQEDHCYDEACHICMARPIGADMDVVQHVAQVHASQQVVKQLDTASFAAAQELFAIKRKLAESMGDAGDKFLRDPALDPEIYGLTEDVFDDNIDAEADELIHAMPRLRELLR
jgi:hypothetical protein